MAGECGSVHVSVDVKENLYFSSRISGKVITREVTGVLPPPPQDRCDSRRDALVLG